MKTVTLRDLEHFGPRYESYEQWQAEEFFSRPFTPKPRRRIRQVEPQRLRDTFVDRELVIGGRSEPGFWSPQWRHLFALLLFIAALFVFVVLSGGRFSLE